MKRGFLFALVLALLVPAAMAEVHIGTVTDYETDQYAILFDEEGKMLTPVYTFSEIEAISETLYAAEAYEAGKYEGPQWMSFDEEAEPVALMDAQGSLLTGFDYVGFEHDGQNGVVIARKPDHTVCVLDERGTVLSDSGYRWMAANGEDGYLALRPDGGTDPETGEETCALILLEADGTEFATRFRGMRYSFGDFSDGLLRMETGNGMIGEKMETVFLNARGEEVFRVEGDETDDFCNGLSVVGGGAFGVVNTQGEWVIPREYPKIVRFAEYGEKAMILGITQDGVLDIFMPTGEKCASFGSKDRPVSSAWQENPEVIVVRQGDLKSWLTMDGTLLWQCNLKDPEQKHPQMTYREEAAERFVMEQGTYPNRHDCIVDGSFSPVSDDFQMLRLGCWKDGQGRYVVTKYDVVNGNGENERMGVCDENGSMLLEPMFDSVTCLSPDRFWVERDGVFNLIDAQGYILLEASLR